MLNPDESAETASHHAPLRAVTPDPESERPAARVATGPVAGIQAAPEFGGPTGPEPTRYGDWERKGRCIDF